MGSAISFRLNPKNESDKKILDWLEEKSIEDWISEAILLSREEFIKIVQESSQNVANNMFAGVLGAMAQQMNMGAVPMSQMTGTVPNSVPGNMQNMIFNTAQGNVSGNGSIHVTDAEASDNELAADTSVDMDDSTKSMLGSLFDMDDD